MCVWNSDSCSYNCCYCNYNTTTTASTTAAPTTTATTASSSAITTTNSSTAAVTTTNTTTTIATRNINVYCIHVLGCKNKGGLVG
jgi:wyosine [tRNA(Phe)-imidazoG37] synthetase (radical SAM superfamily)